MASVKFQKGSEEWMIFMDFYALCQKYWIPEKEDEWWEELIHETNQFTNKYKGNKFAYYLTVVFVNRYINDKYKEMEGKNGKE